MERREYFRYVEKMLYLTKAIRKSVKDIRAEQGAKKGHTGGTNGGAYISDTTANCAIRNVTPIKSVNIIDNRGKTLTICQPERWLEVYDKVYLKQNALGKKVMRSRYWQGERYIKTCLDNDISKDVYYAELDNIYCLSLAAACEIGVVSVIE